MTENFEWNEVLKSMAEVWPQLLVMLVLFFFVSGLAMHKSAKWLDVGYSSLGRGMSVILLDMLASIPLSALTGMIEKYVPMVALQIVSVVLSWVVLWIIVKWRYKVSFPKAIGISIFAGILSVVFALLLFIPVALLFVMLP